MVLRSCGRGRYAVFSESGKRLGKCASKKSAEHRLKQVEYFKYLSRHSGRRPPGSRRGNRRRR